jgi:hypothetical protein
MKPKPKQPKAPWTKAFPQQAKALRPENGLAGGVKARSQSQAQREAVYRAINELFASAHPYCEVCHRIPELASQWLGVPHLRQDTHHRRGREGLLLFDVRNFVSTCRRGHQWIGENIEAARKLGLIAECGQWNNIK